MCAFENFMIKHGAIIRAIPYERTSILEVRHKDKFPDGTLYYDETFGRDMLKITRKNSQGGKFIITTCTDQGEVIRNWGKPVIFYDSIEQAIASLGFICSTE